MSQPTGYKIQEGMEPEPAHKVRIQEIVTIIKTDPAFLWRFGDMIRDYLEEQSHSGDYPPMTLDAWVEDLALWIFYGYEEDTFIAPGETSH